MTASTLELLLAQATDSDDSRQYLTRDLYDALKKLDDQFNQATGHNHNGVHQGAPITSAVTQVGSAVGSASDPTTTSTVFVDLPEMTVTLGTTGGRLIAWLYSVLTVSAGTLGSPLQTALSLDGAAEVALGVAMPQTLNYRHMAATFCDFGSPAAGSHTIKGRWRCSTSGFTGMAVGTQRSLLVMELKR